jgi:hypothetical protein
VKAASRDFLLLQQAECFLLRRIMKVRNAFGIYRLRQVGGVLNEQLENHLHDTLMNHEIEAGDISRRTAQVDEMRCLNERIRAAKYTVDGGARGMREVFRSASWPPRLWA